MEEGYNNKKTIIAILLLAGIVIIGIVGYMGIEGFGAVDAFYMTIITLTTVGFGEVHPLGDEGKIFTAVLSFISLGFFAYSISVITTYFVEGQLNYLVRGYKIKSNKKMEKHVIVIGFGRNGQQVIEELFAHNHPFVVIDQSHDVLKGYQGKPVRFIQGDATEDAVLQKAGIERAIAVISTLPNDADNLFVALTARSLNTGLKIVSRASSESNERKLRVAGVNSVVMPEKVGGAHMAKLIARPDVVEFLEHLSIQGTDPTNLEEIECRQLPDDFINKTIYEIGVRKKSGANIVGFKTPEGKYIINPTPDTRVIPNAKLFVLGTHDQIESMKKILRKEE
nr:potassium channel protein [Bacteroidota bacterium]